LPALIAANWAVVIEPVIAWPSAAGFTLPTTSIVPEVHCRVAANSHGVRQHRGQLGDVDRSAEFQIVVAGGEIRVEPTANGGLT